MIGGGEKRKRRRLPRGQSGKPPQPPKSQRVVVEEDEEEDVCFICFDGVVRRHTIQLVLNGTRNFSAQMLNGSANAYATYVKEYFIKTFGGSVKTYDQENLKNTAVNGDTSGRLWWFQVCTEVAYFQVAPLNDSIRSSKVDTRYHLDLCRNVFRAGIYPDVNATNLYYGGTKIAGLKIVFTNGSQDPWRHASKQTSSPEMPSYIISCHNCGHGTDLRGCPQSPLVPEGDAKNCSSPDAVRKVREKIVEHIDLWLSQCQVSGRSSV